MRVKDTAPFRHRLYLVVAGAVGGVLAAFPLLYFFHSPDGNTSFQSLSHLRSRMSVTVSPHEITESGVPLRALVEPHPDDDIIYVLRPNLAVRFQGVEVITNSERMRQGPVQRRKAVGTFRIAVLGDSFAFGWGVAESETFVRRTEERLRQIKPLPDRMIEILNFGVPGYSTFQEAALFEHVVRYFEPDAVIIYFVENDFGLPFLIGSPTGLVGALGIVQSIYRRGSDAELSELRALEARADANRAIQRLAESLRREAIPLLVVFNPGKGAAEMRRKLWAARQTPGVVPIGLIRGVKKIISERKIPIANLTLPTDPHPSALKHDLISEVLTAKLCDWLSGQRKVLADKPAVG